MSVNKPTKKSAVLQSTARSTKLVDQFMTYFVKIGGILIITIVCGIFLFIFSQILPLFRGAVVQEDRTVAVPDGDYCLLGADEWSELPFLMNTDGKLVFTDLVGERGCIEMVPDLKNQGQFSAYAYNPVEQSIVFGDNQGSISFLKIGYHPEFTDNQRSVEVDLVPSDLFRIGDHPISAVSYGANDRERLVATIQSSTDEQKLIVALMKRKKSLVGGGKLAIQEVFDLTDQLLSPPQSITVNYQGTILLVAGQSGEVHYFLLERGQLELVQCFRPFDNGSEEMVSSLDFLLGGMSVVLTSDHGANQIYSLFYPHGSKVRLFDKTKTFPNLDGPAEFFFPSLRNRAFLVGTGNMASLRHGTTAATRWQNNNLEYQIRLAAISGKYDRLFFLDQQHNLHAARLDDPHPEINWRALFGKVWYEGHSEPRYEWQSTGATDDFEPKLSLVPLIFGTLKGTLYAMLFATPLSLLAAVYASDFMHRRFRVLVKPTMEIMASLPSVVLGFLGALWLAPLIEDRVPSVLMILFVVPLFALVMGLIWSFVPQKIRSLFSDGNEFLIFLPVMLLGCWIAWYLGAFFENVFCVVTDPQTGERLADFRSWWPQVTGTSFEQRNSLVVGFMMGFAVIPIIFTITEDSLSNVPTALRSASLALGATRWQTALKVVLPTASPGIFSAIMIGLGRAVGETMIVVMATGNTPIMELNIFSGMRTLSANIAVELPEAPYHGTLYRTLFLGAMVLFMMTFLVNTVAEVLRQHLRNKYKTVE